MKLYVSTDHDTHYPVGAASIVYAGDEDEARRLLDEALTRGGLKPSGEEPYTLKLVPADSPRAVVLVNGDY